MYMILSWLFFFCHCVFHTSEGGNTLSNSAKRIQVLNHLKGEELDQIWCTANAFLCPSKKLRKEENVVPQRGSFSREDRCNGTLVRESKLNRTSKRRRGFFRRFGSFEIHLTLKRSTAGTPNWEHPPRYNWMFSRSWRVRGRTLYFGIVPGWILFNKAHSVVPDFSDSYIEYTPSWTP